MSAARPAPEPTRRKSRIRLVFLVVLAVPLLLIAVELLVRPYWNPLRRSPETIATSLREQTPPGSTRAYVVTWVNAQGWPHGGRPYPLDQEPPLERMLGQYNSYGFNVVVFARWVFGPDDRLQEVEVWKWVNNAP